MKGRSPLWWKSGRFLTGVWAIGTLLVAGFSLPILYGQFTEAQGLAARYQAMSRYIDAHREAMDASAVSDPPSPDALFTLVGQVPPEREIPRLLLQLQDAASSAGVKLNAIRIADSREELDRLGTADESSPREKAAGKAESDRVEGEAPPERQAPEPPPVPHVERIWLDVHLDANLPRLKEWFRQLQRLPRIVAVQEWEHRLKSQPGYGNARIRLVVYAYRDPALKGLPALSEPVIPRQSGEPILIRPKEEEKDKKEKDKKEG